MARGIAPMSLLEITLLVLLLGAFSPAALGMAEVWSAVDYYAHGFLVAPVAMMMAWPRLDVLRGPRQPRSALGLLVLLVALAGYGTGLAAGILSLQGLSLVVALEGFVLWLWGAAALRRLGAPIAYLVFMVPLPPQWITPVVAGLQGFVSQTAIVILHAMAVPVLREGNVIVLPEGALFVAEACSGITSIVTLLPVAALLAFYTQSSARQTAVLLAAVVPVAMLWNLVRVLLTVQMALALGVARATTGWLHESAGLLTYVLGCLALLLLAALLLRIRGPSAEQQAG